MKVLHLSTSDSGGAGKAAYRLNMALSDYGVNSSMLVLLKKRDDDSVFSVCGGEGEMLWERTMARWNGQLSTYPERPEGLEFFSSVCSDVNLLDNPEIASADVIHLHWVAGMLDYHVLPQQFSGKPIVWTLHDMNPFTGGCHYAGACLNFKDSCGACPQLNSTRTPDLSSYIWDTKKSAYSGLDISIVAPSNWLACQASVSSLFREFPVSVIPNSVPTDIFKPCNREMSRLKHNIPLDAKVVLFGADDPMNRRKGFAYLMAALRENLIKLSGHSVVLAVFGRLEFDLQSVSDFPVYVAGLLESEEKLAELYGLADLFVLPSLEDNLPNTVLESMSCSTPVVAFDVGGISDMIIHKETGFLAKPASVGSLAEGILWGLSACDDDNVRRRCRQHVLGAFSSYSQAERFAALYESVGKTKGAFDCPQENILVSAIVSTYNSEFFIRGCLEDLTGQTLFAAGRLEIIVVDSASPQNEGAIVHEFIGKYGDRIRYIRTEAREAIYQAWSRGVRAARGKYITNANTDDRHRADALERMAKVLEANPDIALVYADCLVTSAPNQTFEHHIRCGYHMRPDYKPEIMLSGCHMGPQPMWRRSVHDTAGYFSEQYRSAGDYEFWCRIAARYSLMHIPEFLGLYYENPRGFANSDVALSMQESISIQQAYAGSFPSPAADYALNFQYYGAAEANNYVNICLVTHNNLTGVKAVIEALVRNTDYPHVISVADIGSSDGTRNLLLALKNDGLVTNLLLLDGGTAVAEAFEQAERCEPAACYRIAFGNSIVACMPCWLSVFISEAQAACHAAPMLTNRIWSRDRRIQGIAGIIPAFNVDQDLETCFYFKVCKPF